MDNQDIILIFTEIAQMLELKGDNPFRIRAYQRAAQNIENLTEELENIANRDELTSIAGIGPDLAKKIKEIISTGSLRYYEQLKKTVPEGILLMLEVPGLGPKKIKLIYEKLKIDSIEKLEKAARVGELNKLEGIREKTQENILRGIEIFKKSKQIIPSYLALRVAAKFVKELKNMDEVERVALAGSLRREKQAVKDIDILVITEEPKVVMNRFSQLDLVDEVLASGDTKTSVIARGSNIQVDLRVLDKSSFGSALLYFTGSKEFNIALRAYAAKKGYKINEYGIFPTSGKNTDKSLASQNEEEVFSLLGMAYIPPVLRENRGEITKALSNKIPRLVKIADIKGDLHVHSRYSDGMNSIEEIANEAKRRGYEYIGIADHSQSLVIANGLSIRELYTKIDEVKKLNMQIKGIKILCGAEIDILTDGSLDYPDKVLKELDFVIAAIHGGFRQSKEQLTKRIISACKNKHVNIIAHPTGVLWGARDAYEIDFERVFRVAKSENVALEINSHPHRLDLDDMAAMKAKSEGLTLALGTDAHVIEALDFMELGVSVARRGWLEKKNILNCRDTKELLKWLKK